MVTAVKKTYIKFIFRGIKGGLNRFLSILGIVALGIGFMAGLMATTPDMQSNADRYFDDSAFYDINIKGTLGVTEQDVNALDDLADVACVMPAYVQDAVMQNQKDESFVTRILGTNLDLTDSNQYLNQVQLISGRMPEAADECVIVVPNGYRDSHSLGDTFSITSGDEGADNLADTYLQTTFTVVGIAASPFFISVEDEASKVGNGTVSLAMFVKEECFSLAVYTDLYLTVKGAKNLNTFSDGYFDLIDRISNDLEQVGAGRSAVRRDEVISKASEELNDAKSDYEEAKTEAEQKLADAGKEIDDGTTELQKVEDEIAKAQRTLDDRNSQLSENKSAYNSALAELEASKVQLEAVRDDIARAKELQAAGIQLKEEVQLQITQYDSKTITVAETEQRLAEAKAELDQFERALQEAQTELDGNIQTLESHRRELEDAKETYHYEKENAESELGDAWEKIKEAEEEIEAIENPEWYILDRRDNVGFDSYKSNVEKVSALSKVFPVFFLLVAALVALTTMTRMVEEQRTQIGTLKSLGYARGTIFHYYLIYSVLASFLGCLLGLIPGFKIFPTIINNAYGMMYTLPEIQTPFRWEIALLLSPLLILGITLTSYAACRLELKNRPARLLVASAPKPGKRILLERITPIWKRLPFTYKVTSRNLFRYKRRFLMTIIGIAGCTALLLAGFGIKDSISDIVGKQFGEIYQYNLSIRLSNEKAAEEDVLLSAILSDETAIHSYLQTHSESASISYREKSGDVHLSVPQNTEVFKEYITLRERKSGRDIVFDDNSVVITEKLAETLGLSVGDSFKLTLDSGVSAMLTISGITENYVSSYLYMSNLIYQQHFQSSPEYTQMLIQLTDTADPDELLNEILKSEQVEYSILMNSLMDSFNNSMNSINYIVVVLILCAGALAIIVLYNLTNVNICERKKELATIKVLGFYDGEVYSYIFREINMLSIIGTLFGLLLGIWLHAFVINTVELDSIMFGRNIYLPSFLLSAAITIGFTLFVNLLMRKQLKRIDMVESMKAND